MIQLHTTLLPASNAEELIKNISIHVDVMNRAIIARRIHTKIVGKHCRNSQHKQQSLHPDNCQGIAEYLHVLFMELAILLLSL